MDSSFLYLDDIMLQYDEDVVNRDFEKIWKIKNPRRSFNLHGYVNNNTVCSLLCYINVRLKIQNIFDLGY